MSSAFGHALPIEASPEDARAAQRRLFALAATLIAIIVYPIGIGLPALTVEKMGRIRESSVLDGVRNLFDEGRIFLALVIGITALVLPPLKMFGLVWLAVSSESSSLRRRFAPILTLIGRWGFLDLFVAGLLVAWVQMNSLIRFEPQIGLIFFGISVLLSYLASVSLDRNEGARQMTRATTEEATAPKPEAVAAPLAKPSEPAQLPRDSRRRNWLIAGLAVFALLLGLIATWVYYRQGRNQLEVTVQFDNAHGLRTGAEVRHRGVIVGKVNEVRIRPNSEGVLIRIRLQPEAEELAREGSYFYIVRPSVSLSNGIRGLDTAIGDVYVEIARTRSAEGGRKTEFVGSEEPPLPDIVPGSRQFVFTAKRVSLALTAGAPVRCRGFQIGHIRSVKLTDDGGLVEGEFVVEERHLRLMDKQAKFAAVSFVLGEASFGIINARLDLPALSGGIELKQLPPKLKEPAPPGHVFPLLE